MFTALAAEGGNALVTAMQGVDFSAIGDTISAGDILGFMGNSGYGKEGTIGKFPVHLHLGIYIPTLYTDEMSVNPYHILDILRKNTRKYTYS